MINILHLGDITKINGAEVPIVDVITGGSPCQDLSVAGLRKGLAGERSGLFMEQMRIVKEMRNESRRQLKESGADFSVCDIKPRYLVWENVTGAYSSGKPEGADFQAVLEEITRVVCNEAPTVPIPAEGWPYAGCLEGVGEEGLPFSICWRTHDAQYWGVPQRRRRIALVADFGGSTASEILFERQGESRNPKQSRAQRQGSAPTVGASSEITSTVHEYDIGAGPGSGRVTYEGDTVTVYENHGQDTRYTELGEVCNTVSATYGMGGNNTPFVVKGENSGKASTIAIEGNGSRDSHKGDGYSESDVMYTLNTVEQHGVCYGFQGQASDMSVVENATPTTVANQIANVAIIPNESSAVESHPQDSRVRINPDDINQTISSNMEHDPANGGLVLQKTTEQHGVCYGFQGQAGASTGMSVVEDGAPTMVANQVTNVIISSEPILLESNQNHATVQTDGISTTLPASMGEGGGYVPMVVDDKVSQITQEGVDLYNLKMTGEVSPTLSTMVGTPDGTGGKVLMSNIPTYGVELGAASRVGGHVTEEVAPTIRAEMGDNQTAIVYGMSSYDSNAMKSDNPNSGIYKADTARTLDLNGGNPACNQGGMMVVQGTMGKSAKESVKAYGVTTKGNGDAFIAEDRHTSLSTGGGEAGQGYPCVLTESEQPEGCLNPWDVQSKHIQPEDGVAESLYAAECRYGGGESYVMQKSPVQSMELFHCISEEEKVQTLKARDYKDPQVVCVDMGGGKSQCNVAEDQSPTLTTTHGGEPAVLSIENHPNDSRVKIRDDGTVQTLSGRMGTGGGNVPMVMGEPDTEVDINTSTARPNSAMVGTQSTSVVRRLTPMECERLQGFPDGWTDIGDWVDTKGKKHKSSDSPRYKALGNSIALPFWDWMAGRMCDQLRDSGVQNPTMASLFDGISGFPLVYLRHNCVPKWTSEIEEFPIAVCKKHFGDEETGEEGDCLQYLDTLSFL